MAYILKIKLTDKKDIEKAKSLVKKSIVKKSIIDNKRKRRINIINKIP